MKKLVRNTLVAALLATGAVATGSPAQAIPPAGQNESVTFVYYSDASKTVQVGGYSYGSCGEPFEWGIRTSYVTWWKTYC